ncbi:fructokinase [Novosphingobium chloroacetimidivorans]|uniref:fructokinase n=1 Tax=Novosphingobium chloroacetimidivorans TaxID=1428314 RepID=A0A7W7K7I4_9SPHN|nr:ROK family protein [Novosphingobium chloroacetimidivorans]MBB4857385.1 fructokinase [Novosphingobium chloroacetimidivorans]
MPLYAGLEMGGTKTIVVLGEPGAIRERIEFATSTPEETLGRAASEVGRWHRDGRIAGLGVASFGPVRLARTAPDYGTILDTPKPGWRGTQVVGILRAGFPGPIALDTDVNAAAMAEHEMGAGRGCASLIYLTIGTGVGGGVLVRGDPMHGVMHPEIGHMRLRRAVGDRFEGACRYHGACVEGLISGSAIEARFGCVPAEVPWGDPRWHPIASDLAELLANLLLAFSPERIIVGGGVAMRQPQLLAAAIDQIPERLAGYLGATTRADLAHRIVAPALGNDAGPNGSLCLAKRASR